MKLQILTVLVLTLTSASHRAKLCWAAEVPLCKAVWKPRAATSNSSCGSFWDLKWEIKHFNSQLLSCSMAQTLLPLGSAAFSCPHPPYSCKDVIDYRAVVKERYEPQSSKSTTLHTKKKIFRGEILHSLGE